ncbi:MAG: glycosyltransferase family 2 protein, partial [Deltaproteobacteria bacterium]
SAAPDVSVVVPTFNRAHVLGASLASLLAETGVDLELIVVDDGSTDDTAAWLEAHPDPRVRAIRGPHAGIAAARNRGLAAARAPFVAFHDSDDLALPGRLGVPVAHLRAHPDVDVVIQNGRMLPADRPWIAPRVARLLAARPLGVADVFRWNLGQLQGMCFTRRSLEATGPLDATFDTAFTYHVHADGVARDRRKVREESIRLADKLVREHPEVLPLLGPGAFARRQARRYGRLATMRLAAGDVEGAREALARARALRPLDLRYRLRALWLGEA